MSTGALKAIFTALLLAAGLFLYITCATMPEQVASHFDAQGRANSTMSRNNFFLFMLGVTVVLPLLLVFLTAGLPRILPPQAINIPHRTYWLAPERRKETLAYMTDHAIVFGCILTVFLTGVCWMVAIANSLKPPHLPGGPFVMLVASFFVALGVWIFSMFRRFGKTGEQE